ncbi:hypothetical protein ACFE04_012552 [Oxalis oulophora]
MVVLSQPALLDQFSLIKTCKPTTTLVTTNLPTIDLFDPQAKHHIVKACQDLGFFKLTNHGISMEYMTRLESEAVNFFNLPQSEKDRAGPPDPFGYGCKIIGPNGDVGWVEYLLLNSNPQVPSQKTRAIFHDDVFRSAVEKYVMAVKSMAYEVVELMADGLDMEERDVFSKLLRNEKSDSCFRLNHYPSCPVTELQAALSGRNLIGFGEHTDPQIISVLRSNNTSGLQICLKDGSWVSVPPDNSSFFINVGDALQVMTNGRFKSVKHRVLAGTGKSRVSMIYFGGPPLSEKIAPIPQLLAKESEESLYKEFLWHEYKMSAYKSKLADYRLGPFEINKKAAGQ